MASIDIRAHVRDNGIIDNQECNVPKPSFDQIKTAIESQAKTVGKVNVSVREVALSLDSLCGDMTEEEYKELRAELIPLINEVRFLGQIELWTPAK